MSDGPAPASLSGFLSTLVPTALIAGGMILAFAILRPILVRNYAPRTFLLREQERTPELPKSFLGWLGQFFKMPDTWVLNHQSIDGYLLLRYLKISTVICLVGCLITWPVLFPVNATAGGGGKQFNMLSFGNVPAPNNPRYYAHAFVAWVFFSFVWYMITRETIYYINIRQAYLLSPLYAHRMSSRTVLFASVPDDYLDSGKIRKLFGDDLKNFWISTDCKELAKLVEERDKVAMKLEGAEVKLIKMANDNRLKAIKDGKSSEADIEKEMSDAEMNGESGSVAAKWVPIKKRPTHRLKPLIGKKVDTINWCRDELKRLVPEVKTMQDKQRAGDAKYINSIIVEFHTQAQAQEAYQCTTHHQPLHMAPRYIGVNPEEIIWNNMRILWWERLIRYAATIGMVCVTIIFWAIPVAFVGILSNLNALIDGVDGKKPIAPWLGFLRKMPSQIFGVITGLLPSILLAVLMALLPIFLRAMAKLGGCMTTAQVELRTQNFYFAFQVVQVFLVATLASAATAVGQEIAANPSSAANLLAQNIPKASNFYVSYFVLQGLTFTAGAVLQIVGVILFRVLGKVLDKTPRKIYKRWITLSGLGWGTVFPIYSLLICISIIYSCIAPLVMGFATVGLYFFYLAFKYNLLFVYNANIDTKGLVYPRALQHITVGIYIALVCMIGLFGMSRAPGPLVVTVVYLILSILYHVSLSSAVAPLLATLPKTLEIEEQNLLAMESGATNGHNGHHEHADNLDAEKGASGQEKKPSFVAKWLHPDKYCDYRALRKMVPTDFADVGYAEEVARDAYFNPAVVSDVPTLWVPRDAAGVSAQEVAHTRRVVPISDEGAAFDDKGKIVWDTDSRPPIYEEKIYY